MVQKVIEIVGTSEKGFTQAADNAIKVASETVRGITCAKVSAMTCKVKDGRVAEYRALMRIYFDVER